MKQSVFNFGSDRYFFKHYFIRNFLVITLRGGVVGVDLFFTSSTLWEFISTRIMSSNF